MRWNPLVVFSEFANLSLKVKFKSAYTSFYRITVMHDSHFSSDMDCWENTKA
jgi:hypothetical protein